MTRTVYVLPKSEPLSYGALTKEQFDIEIEKGRGDVKAGRVCSADTFSAEMKKRVRCMICYPISLTFYLIFDRPCIYGLCIKYFCEFINFNNFTVHITHRA